MSRSKRLSRRELLQHGTTAALLAGAGGLHVACRRTPVGEATAPPGGGLPRHPRPNRDFARNLVALIVAVGPWPERDRRRAVHFADRYLARRAKRFEPQAALIDSLTTKVAAEGKQLDEVDITRLSAAERSVLTEIIADVHSVAEVRWYLAGVGPPGTCLGFEMEPVPRRRT